MTPAGLIRLELDEGCRLRAYQDSGGVWTIGYGCTGAGIGPGAVWTQAEADAELATRVARAEAGLARVLPEFTALDPVRRDVLTNIAFNIGVDGLARWPITLGAVRAGRFDAAADDIASNTLWASQVGARARRCSEAMRTGSWAPTLAVAYGASASAAAVEA